MNGVEVSNAAGWGDIVTTFAGQYAEAAKLAPDSPLKAEAARIRAQSKDPLVQAGLALALVQNQVRYLLLALDGGGYRPMPADTSWARRLGDCKAKTVLLIALLTELGIEARPVLVNSRFGDSLADALPRVTAFDHVIVEATIAGKRQWLNGTEAGETRLDRLRPPPFRWGLPLADGVTALEPIPTATLTGPDLRQRLDIDARREPGPFVDAPFAFDHPEWIARSRTILLPAGGKGYSMRGKDFDRSVGIHAFTRKAVLEGERFQFDGSMRSLAPEIAAAQARAAEADYRLLANERLHLRAPPGYIPTRADVAALAAETPGTVEALLLRASLYENAGEIRRAVADGEAALKLDPGPACPTCASLRQTGREARRLVQPQRLLRLLLVAVPQRQRSDERGIRQQLQPQHHPQEASRHARPGKQHDHPHQHRQPAGPRKDQEIARAPHPQRHQQLGKPTPHQHQREQEGKPDRPHPRRVPELQRQPGIDQQHPHKPRQHHRQRPQARPQQQRKQIDSPRPQQQPGDHTGNKARHRHRIEQDIKPDRGKDTRKHGLRSPVHGTPSGPKRPSGALSTGRAHGASPAARPQALVHELEPSSSRPIGRDRNVARTGRLMGRWIVGQLVVLGFDGLTAADEVLNKVRSLKAEHLVDLEDAVVAIRDPDGKVQIKQAVNLTALGATSGGLSGAFWGTLVGLLFLNPLAGMAIGAASGAGAGALSGSLMDYGVNDDFVKKLSETIPNGSSALFVLVRDVTMDKVVEAIQPWNPRVLNTSLSKEQEAKLVEALKPHV